MKEAVTAGASVGAYSPAIVAEGRFLYVSGQGPLTDGMAVPGTIAEETELTIANLQTVLRVAGADLADVVKCGVFLADIGDFQSMDAVYRRVFPTPLPARTTVGAQLAMGIKVEIDCVAVVR